jgi:hypothetical protein
MKKLVTRSLLGVAAVAIPVGAAVALPTAAHAATPGQGAQKASLEAGGTPECGAPGVVNGTAVAHDFVILNKDAAGGVSVTVNLQSVTPKSSYFVVLYDQNCVPQHLNDGSNPVVTTDSLGNASYNFNTQDPTITSGHVVLFTSDWNSIPFASPTVPLS